MFPSSANAIHSSPLNFLTNFQIFLFLLIGFVPALIFAWAFEMTPEGLKKEKDVDRSQSITPVTGKKMDRGIIIALAIAVVFLLVDKFVLQDAPGVSEQQPTGQTSVEPQEAAEASRDLSIAVLPFVDMSEAGDSAYFADGLSEELLNLLAKITSGMIFFKATILASSATIQNRSS